MTIDTKGSVGIGTTTPTAMLDVRGQASFQGAGGLSLQVGDAGCTGTGYAGLGPSPLSGCTNYALLVDGKNTYLNRPTGGAILFREGNNDSMTLSSGGNLTVNGSGTFISPNTAGQFLVYGAPNVLVGGVCFEGCSNVFRVDRTGKVFADGGYQSGGADFAESFAVAGDRGRYHAGDLLRVDPKSNRRLRLTDKPYSTLVTGIYSTKPGVLATPHRMDDSEIASEVPLAVVGIVPCKVSTENGPIRRGDLLVSSSTPGYAMRGTDRRRMLGAVVGNALEPLASGKGVIEVLVTLQ